MESESPQEVDRVAEPESCSGSRAARRARQRLETGVVILIAGILLLFTARFAIDVLGPSIDTRSVQECLKRGQDGGRTLPEPITSGERIWQPRGTDAIAFSNDSRFLATGGSSGAVNVWSTADWTRAGGFKLKGEIRKLAFSPDDRFLYVAGGERDEPAVCCFEWREGKRYPYAEGDSDQADKRIPSPDRLTHSTPDGKYQIIAQDHYSRETGQEIWVQCWDLEGSRHDAELARFSSKPDDEVRLAVSPRGDQVAVGAGDVCLRLFTLPHLAPFKTHRYPSRGFRSGRIKQIAYSPDGAWLAVAQDGRPRPRLFNPKTGEELVLHDGHAERILNLQFSDDGQRLRSVGYDGTVCVWKTATLEMLQRISLPMSPILGNSKPLDCRYAICQSRCEPAYEPGRDPNLPSEVVNLETGKSLCRVSLPVNLRGYGSLFWLRDSEALCVGHDWRCRFDYRTGAILEKERNEFRVPYYSEVTEDGVTAFHAKDFGKNTPPWTATTFNLNTLNTTDLGEIETKEWPNGPFGLVPGGKYFHLGSQIFDRRTLKLVAATLFPDDEENISVMAFSPEGSRYAAVLLVYPDGKRYYPRVEPDRFLYVQETLTNRMLTAFKPPARPTQLCFSSDGEKLAIAYDDGVLEIRSLPAE